MATQFLLTSLGPIVAGMSLETFLLRKSVPLVYEKSEIIPAVPRAYGLVLFTNVCVSSVLMLTLGFKVAAARKLYTDKALKDGDKDAEARYAYPKLYAEGFSDPAKAFNCVQRAHQQALETYPQFLALSLVGGVQYPLTCAVGGALWVWARWVWAEGYATGDPSKRYGHVVSRGIWTGLLVQIIAAGATSLSTAIN